MVLSKLTIRDVPLDNHTVLVRVDYDVPYDSLGIVSDDSSIRASLPTIRHLLDRGCKVVLISHVSSPNGIDPAPSLEPTAHRLANLLGQSIRFTDVITKDRVYQVVKRSPKNSVIMLENLYFHNGEKLNSVDFAKTLAEATMARYFIQDSPNIVHKAHASTDLITHFIPSVAGFLLVQSGISDNNLPGIVGLLDARIKKE